MSLLSCKEAGKLLPTPVSYWLRAVPGGVNIPALQSMLLQPENVLKERGSQVLTGGSFGGRERVGRELGKCSPCGSHFSLLIKVEQLAPSPLQLPQSSGKSFVNIYSYFSFQKNSHCQFPLETLPSPFSPF